MSAWTSLLILTQLGQASQQSTTSPPCLTGFWQFKVFARVRASDSSSSSWSPENKYAWPSLPRASERCKSDTPCWLENCLKDTEQLKRKKEKGKGEKVYSSCGAAPESSP